MKRYDVVVVGGGPAGLYSSIVLKRGIPTSTAIEDISVCVLEQGIFGGLTKYGHITISKKWSFSGSNVTAALCEEANDIGVELKDNERVLMITPHLDCVEVVTNKDSYRAEYIIIATGLISNPDLLRDESKYTIALHTPMHMVDEINEKHAKKILLYGPNEKSLITLKKDISSIDTTLNLDIKTSYLNGKLIDVDEQISKEEYEKFDLIMLDYNSYKVSNESIPRLGISQLHTVNNFCITDEFGETNYERVFATGTAANIISGVLMALTSALVTSLKIGRMLNKTTKAEPSGRFPWFPRETSWDDSWLPFYENEGGKLSTTLSIEKP